MKQLFSITIALFILCAMLPGCGARNGATDPEKNPVTEELAYEGVSNYCRSEYGWTDGEGSSYLTMGEETDSEYRVIFRSYTGSVVTFHVEKASGTTRIVEYVPALDREDDVGTINLLDYMGKEPPAEPTDVPSEPKGHYAFRPKVCSVYMEEVFGETMCDTWYHLVDAVMAGEDTFACPDQHTYDWVMGQFPRLCFPVLTELIDRAWDREHSVVDGVASFTWLVPPEEAAVRIGEFAQQIEGILNDTLEDDYSDFEKALALYKYFSRTYVYDWETFEKKSEAGVDYTTTYRLFKTGMGICSEIAPAYSYLLMQAGVEATVMMGGDHEWSYVRINGRDYHIDPTYVLTDVDSLSYFMMTDQQRETTGYGKDVYVITSNYSKDNPHPDYTADDDTYSPLWGYRLEEFFPNENRLRCWRYAEDGEKDYLEFDYVTKEIRE